MDILTILSLLVSIGWFICFIIVLIKLFQEKGALHGILGFLCFLYTFIWGWMHAARLNIKNVMLVWTLLFVVSIILNVMGAGAAVNKLRMQQGVPAPVTTTP